MSEQTFRDWIAFSEVYPFGQDVDDGRFARLSSVIMASVGAKADKLTNPETYMLPQYTSKAPAKRRDPSEVSRQLKAALG